MPRNFDMKLLTQQNIAVVFRPKVVDSDVEDILKWK